jgi:hypothetical protein
MGISLRSSKIIFALAFSCPIFLFASEVDYKYCNQLAEEFKYRPIYQSIYQSPAGKIQPSIQQTIDKALQFQPAQMRLQHEFTEVKSVAIDGAKASITMKLEDGDTMSFKTHTNQDGVTEIQGEDVILKFYIRDGICLPLAFHFKPKADPKKDFALNDCSELSQWLPASEMKHPQACSDKSGWMAELKKAILQDSRFKKASGSNGVPQKQPLPK